MIFGERARAVETLLLARPMAHHARPLRPGVDRLQNSQRLHGHERTGTVVRRARGAVPRIEVRREHDVFVGLLGALDDADRVECRHFAEETCVEVEADARLLLVFRETIEETIVLAGQRHRGRGFVVGLEDLDRAPATRALRAAAAAESAATTAGLRDARRRSAATCARGARCRATASTATSTAAATGASLLLKRIREAAQLRARRDHAGDASFLETHAQRARAKREAV